MLCFHITNNLLDPYENKNKDKFSTCRTQALQLRTQTLQLKGSVEFVSVPAHKWIQCGGISKHWIQRNGIFRESVPVIHCTQGANKCIHVSSM